VTAVADRELGLRGPADPPAEPPRHLRYRRHQHQWAAMRELAGARHIIRTLAERWILVRYKQAFLGIAWVVITPLLYMVAFSLLFQRVAKVDTGGVPYNLFVYVALLPWMLFSSSVGSGTTSLLANIPLLNKVYCPREVFPISFVLAAGVDFAISTAVLGVLFLIYRFPPAATSYWVPLLLAVHLTFTIGVTLILSSLVVYLRDLRQMIPMLLQIGIFATPVAWKYSQLSEAGQVAYAAANPLAPVIDGMRRAVLYGQSPRGAALAVGAAAAVVWLVVGFVIFKRLETGIADVA
jgi:ABC-2 type transport system permease protein/lipopolysaccharide transport system permease protein